MSLEELFASPGASMKEYSALTDNADRSKYQILHHDNVIFQSENVTQYHIYLFLNRVAYLYALPMVQKILSAGADGAGSASGLKSPHESREQHMLWLHITYIIIIANQMG